MAKHLHKKVAKTRAQHRTYSDIIPSMYKYSDDDWNEVSSSMKDFFIQGHAKMQKKRISEHVKRSSKLKSGTYAEEVIAAFEKIHKAQIESKFQESLEEARRLTAVVESYPDGELENKQGLLAAAYGCMGDASMEMKRFDKAIEFHKTELDITTKSSLDDDIGWAILHMGNVYARKGEYQQALKTWQDSLSTVHSVSHRALFNMAVGICYIEMCNYMDAISYVERSLAAASESADEESQLYAAGLVFFTEVHLGFQRSAQDSFHNAIAMAKNLKDRRASNVMKKFNQYFWIFGPCSRSDVIRNRNPFVDYLTHIYQQSDEWLESRRRLESVNTKEWTSNKALTEKNHRFRNEMDPLENSPDDELLNTPGILHHSAYFEQGDFSSALKCYRKESKVAKAKLQTALCESKSLSKTALLTFKLGTSYLELGDYTEAMRKGMLSLDAARKASDQKLQMYSTILLAQSEIQLKLERIAVASLKSALQMATDVGDRNAESHLEKVLMEVDFDSFIRQPKRYGKDDVVAKIQNFMAQWHVKLQQKFDCNIFDRIARWKDKSCLHTILEAVHEADNAHKIGSYEISLKKSKEALETLQVLQGKEVETSMEILGYIYSCMGNAYFKMGDFNQAIAYHEMDRNIAVENNVKYAESRAILNLGRLYFSRGEYVHTLHILLDALLGKELPLEIVLLVFEIAERHSDYNDLLLFLDSKNITLDAARRAGDNELLLFVTLLFAHIEVEVGLYPEALNSFEKSSHFAELLDNKEAKSIILEALKKYDTTKYRGMTGAGMGYNPKETYREEDDRPHQVTQDMTTLEATDMFNIRLTAELSTVATSSRNDAILSFPGHSDQSEGNEHLSETFSFPESTFHQSVPPNPEEETHIKELHTVPQGYDEDTHRKELHTVPQDYNEDTHIKELHSDPKDPNEETNPKEILGDYIPGRLGPEGTSNPSSFTSAVSIVPETGTYSVNSEEGCKKEP